MEKIAVRWSGWLMIVGAILLGIAIFMASFNPFGSQSSSAHLQELFLFFSAILLLLSLPAMYAEQASAAGWMGIAGHALLQTGILLLVVTSSTTLRFPSFQPPASAENAVDFFLGISLTLGLLITAIATLWAGIFPRWAGILLLAATAGFFFAFFISELLPRVVAQVGVALLGFLMAAAFSWVGVAMLQRSRIQPQLP